MAQKERLPPMNADTNIEIEGQGGADIAAVWLLTTERVVAAVAKQQARRGRNLICGKRL
jgi:hypothetical protein